MEKYLVDAVIGVVWRWMA